MHMHKTQHVAAVLHIALFCVPARLTLVVLSYAQLEGCKQL